MQNSDHLNISGHLLELFLAIYDTGSVSAAADRLDMNQSTASHHLDKMRVYLGDALFVKSGRGIVPTDRAIALAPRIRHVLTSIEDLIGHEVYDPSTDRRMITISGNIEGFTEIFMKLRQLIRQAAPEIPIRLLELGSRSNIEHFFESAKVDLIIAVRSAANSAQIRTQPVCIDEFGCYYDPKVRGPITSVEEYCSAKHAAVDFGNSGKSLIEEQLERKGLSREVVLYAPNFAILAQLIEGTDRVATQRKGLTRMSFSNLAWCPSPIEFDPLYVDMTWHRRQEFSGRNMWLRDLVKTHIAESASG